MAKFHLHPPRHLILMASARTKKMLADVRFAARMREPVKINAKHDIPYLCGYSWDGKTIYRDRHLKSVMPDGFNCWPTLQLHEMTEKALIDIFGLDYEEAHHIATGCEARVVDATPNTPGWKRYSAFLGPQIKHVDHENITRPPKDLDLTPYEDENEKKLLSKLIRPQLHEKAITLRYHDVLNPELFDGDVLRSEVRDKLLAFAYTWADFAKVPRDRINDVILTGGNANYNYTPESDLDVHLIIDRQGLGFGSITDDWLKAKKELWTLTRHPTVKGYAVEPYAQDMSEPFPTGQGSFSIKDQLWVERPAHGSHNFTNDTKLQGKADHLETLIDDQITKGASEDDIIHLKRRLVKMRREGLIHKGEFSMGNLLFKELRNRGVLQRLSDHLTLLQDRQLSL